MILNDAMILDVKMEIKGLVLTETIIRNNNGYIMMNRVLQKWLLRKSTAGNRAKQHVLSRDKPIDESVEMH